MAKKRTTIDDLARMVAEGFHEVGQRFLEVGLRFDEQNSRHDRHDTRSDRIERKLDAVIEVVKRHDVDIKRLKQRVGV